MITLEELAGRVEALESVVASLQPPPKKPLTMRQAEVLHFIAQHIAQKNYPPSFEEIGAHFEFRSLATVHEHLDNLVSKGWIRRDFNQSRAITVLP